MWSADGSTTDLCGFVKARHSTASAPTQQSDRSSASKKGPVVRQGFPLFFLEFVGHLEPVIFFRLASMLPLILHPNPSSSRRSARRVVAHLVLAVAVATSGTTGHLD